MTDRQTLRAAGCPVATAAHSPALRWVTPTLQLRGTRLRSQSSVLLMLQVLHYVKKIIHEITNIHQILEGMCAHVPHLQQL